MTGKEHTLPAVQDTSSPLNTSALVKIPAFPPIALRLLHLLSNDSVAISEIIEPLRADPAFSAEILRRANSSLFGFSSQISSLQHALVVLGLRRVRALSMTVATGIYLKQALQIEELRRCWRHTLAGALLTEEVARACLMHVDLAYTAGLLHDVGRLGLLVAHPEEYTLFIRNAGVKASGPEAFDLLDFEKETFGIDHCEAGNWLAGQWALPQEFAVVTGRHHDPPHGRETDLLALVYLGCQLANTLGFHVVDTGRFLSFEEIRAKLPESARHRLLADPDALRELVDSRIQSLDIAEMKAPAPAAEEPPPEPVKVSLPEPAGEEPGAVEEAAVETVETGLRVPRRSTLRRDLLAALITCLVGGTAFFFLLRALSE
ncbi:MAG: HDOD domain-containing protein [Acidobacteria bacterium]|nr:HDOD domain-containing protein [Acidobacteriota bacterium]